MDESAANLASVIGVRVRHERQSRGWTLDQLAEAAGVSRRMVVSVEQAAVNPSVGTLLRLSDALGVGLPAVVELWDWTLGPGDQHSSEAHAPGTKELVHVQDGSITVEVADQSVTLDAGDAVAFPGDVAHSYANPSTQPARFSLVVFEPGVGAGAPRSERRHE